MSLKLQTNRVLWHFFNHTFIIYIYSKYENLLFNHSFRPNAFLLFQGCNVTTYEKFGYYINTYNNREDIAVELTKAGKIEVRWEPTKHTEGYHRNFTQKQNRY